MGNYKGVAYRETAQVAFIDFAGLPQGASAFSTTEPKDQLNETAAWSPWGKNNLLPQEMVADIETCGILSGIIDGKARFTLCEGLAPAIVERSAEGKKVVKEWVKDAEIKEFLETNNDFLQCFGWLKDLMGMGNAAVQFILDNEYKKIVRFKRTDISEARFQKMDKAGKIANMFLCADWKAVTSADDKTVRKVRLLDPNNPVNDLKEKAQKRIAEHALAVRYPSWGKHYYSVPLWYATYKWVKIAQGVPEMKAALFQNTMRLKYMVTIYPQYWIDAFPDQWDQFTAEEKELKREQVFNDINNYLVGAKNAHKSIFADGYIDPVSGKANPNIEIKAIEDNTKAGEYLPDSAAANSEIAFAMLWNNALTGGNQASGLYEQSQGGSNVRESFLMQVIIHEFERQLINYIMSVPKYFNGWDKTYPGLEFIIPATILTTTDTGGSVKPKIEKKDATDNNNK